MLFAIQLLESLIVNVGSLLFLDHVYLCRGLSAGP